MYINKLDIFIDKIIDLYNKEITDLISTVSKDKNFVKYHDVISKNINDFTNRVIEENKTKKLISENIINDFQFLLHKYFGFYIYLSIGYYYKDTADMFITNIMETARYQKSSKTKINNLFTIENNSYFTRFFNIIKKIINLTKSKSYEKIKIYLQSNSTKYIDVINFIENIDTNILIDYIFVEDNRHELIKFFIFKELYLKIDKNHITQILENDEEENGEFIYIDVVVKLTDKLDFSAIESVFTPEERARNIPLKTYQFLTESKMKIISENEKINWLLENKIIVPITEEFLRFHKSSDYYEDDNQKENTTKVKNIINKTSQISNFYSPKIKNNKKLYLDTKRLFYTPLFYKKAVLFNDTEEMNILKKLSSVFTVESRNELQDSITELEYIRKYAYHNFRDLNNDGFKFRPNNKIMSIRKTNINSSNNIFPIETRMGADYLDLNIVGFAVNTRNIETKLSNKLVNIKNNEKENGYQIFIKNLKKHLSKNTEELNYWLFDLENDKTTSKTYQNLSSNDMKKNILIMIENIYDEWVDVVDSYIIKYLSSQENLTFYDIENIVKHINGYLDLSFHENLIYNYYNYIITNKKIKIITPRFDENENRIPGITTKSTKLPTYKVNSDKKNSVTITNRKNNLIKVDEKYNPPICYHNITWHNIILKKKHNDFSQAVFNFVKQYVKNNSFGEFICKSCGEFLQVKRYVYDGEWDKESNTFTTTNIVNVQNLKDDKKYSNLKRTIKNMENIIETISVSSNLTELIGNDHVIKMKRKLILKDIIDLIFEHSKINKKLGKERLEKSVKNYNINKNFSYLFFFDLDDNIFMTSSNETDHYKILKYNNILLYILLILIIDFTSSTIRLIKETKHTNYYLFSHGANKLFDNIYIRTSKTSKSLISKYPILCYIIYYFSSLMIQKKLWAYNKEKEIQSIIIQKTIVHSFIDLLNSVIENNFKDEKNFMYEILFARISTKLNSTFSDGKLLQYIVDESNKHFQVNAETKKVSFVRKKFKNLTMEDLEKETKYRYHDPKRCEPQIISNPKNQKSKLINFNNLTNCPDGQFHNWDKHMECTKCKQKMSDILKDNNDDKNVYKEMKKVQLQKLAKIYCLDGKLHDIDVKTNKCKLCSLDINNINYSKDDLKKLEENILNQRYENSIKEFNEKISYNRNNKKYIQKYKDIISNHKEKQKKIDFKEHILQFLKLLATFTGEDITIKQFDKEYKINLFYNSYIIDHNYYGSDLKDSIIISGKDRIKFKYIESLKREVLYYYDNRNNVEVYYDTVTLQLLGFKEHNKDITKSNKLKYLQINYSLYHMIKYIGLQNKYTYFNKDFYDKKSFINDIIDNRISNLKDIINVVVGNLIRINMRTEIKSSDPMINLLKKYILNILNIVIGKSFENWQGININIKKKKVNHKNFKFMGKFFNSDQLIDENNTDIFLINYLINNLKIILKLNDNNKETIGIYIIETLTYLFNKYHIPINNMKIQHFTYNTENSNPLINENITVQGIYNEIVSVEDLLSDDKIEQDRVNNEEQNALDDFNDNHINDD